MKIAIFDSVVLVLIAVSMSCGSSREDILAGKWKCSGVSGAFSYSGEVDYVSGGRSTSIFEFRGDASGSTIEFSGVANGTWAMDGDQLAESVDKFTVVSFAMNGRKLPVDTFPKQVSEALVGASSESTIEKLDDHMLIARFGSDHFSCSR